MSERREFTRIPAISLLGSGLYGAEKPVRVFRSFFEVTFHEARQHLGMKTQRQWDDRAGERTTPLLLVLFFLVTLIAHAQVNTHLNT